MSLHLLVDVAELRVAVGMLCADIVEGSVHLAERGAMPSEGIQGDEWDAYVTLSRTTRTNVGSPTGREPYGDGVPVVVVGVTTHQGGPSCRVTRDGPGRR